MHTVIQCCEYLRHISAAQIAYKITHSRTIQVELGKVEGFRGAQIHEVSYLKLENLVLTCKLQLLCEFHTCSATSCTVVSLHSTNRLHSNRVQLTR